MNIIPPNNSSNTSNSSKTDNTNSKLVFFVSLGCSKNLVDSEVMLGKLQNNGYGITDEAAKATVIVINTCGFLTSAIEEGIAHILEYAAYKKNDSCKLLIVTGCMPQRHKDDLVEGFPEVDLFLGVDEGHKIIDYISQIGNLENKLQITRSSYLMDWDTPRVSTTGQVAMYVKIAEGCNHACSFCIIPKIRGKLKSRSIESVYKEVVQLVKNGVKEITFVAQDLTLYGQDLRMEKGLLSLLERLEQIPEPFWLRLLYNYPENITDDMISFLASSRKVVPYLDIPIQHASNRILNLMRRNITKEAYLTLISKLRKRIKNIAIRTSIIVGFPGETQDDFNELVNFVKQVQFDHLGVFTYSLEQGTYSANLDGHLNESIKEDRLHQIMTVQQDIVKQKTTSLVGNELPVLLLGYSKESDLLLEGRLKTQAPEVDGIVLINKGQGNSGDIVPVKITKSIGYDLVGEIVKEI